MLRGESLIVAFKIYLELTFELHIIIYLKYFYAYNFLSIYKALALFYKGVLKIGVFRT